MMFLDFERNDLQWIIVDIRIQLAKTIRLSTRIDIFEEKKIWQGIKKVFFFNK